MSRRRLAAWILVFLGTTCPVEAQDAAVTLEQLEGEWISAYVDEELGVIQGEARIASGRAEVVYRHPESGRSFSLVSTALRINGDRLVIELSGRSPQEAAERGVEVPEAGYVLSRSASEITVRSGQDSASLTLMPLPETDVDRVVLEFTLDEELLSGTWRYRSHWFLGRAANGFGRAGAVDVDAQGIAWTSGPETWRRPQPIVYGAIPLEEQLDFEMLSDGTISVHYPYPFRPGHGPTGRSRTLFVFGEELPRDHARPITLEAVDAGVSYTLLARRSDAAGAPHYAAMFEEGWRKLRERLPAGTDAGDAFSRLEAFLVRADLQPSVVPGMVSLKVADQEIGWRLQFGDNTASLRIVRPIGRGSQRFETAGFVFPGEFIRVEIETEQTLPLDAIHVFVGVDGKPLLLGDGVGIPAARTGEDARVYRTDIIYVDPKLPAGQAVDVRSGMGMLAIPGWQGARLTAALGEMGAISIPPGMGQATVFDSPGDTGVGGDWSRWLDSAAACVDRSGAGAAVEQMEADRLSEMLIVPEAWIVPMPSWMETRVSIGQHAAMLLLRDTFVRLLERNRAQLARIRSDEEILAFRRLLEPLVRRGRTPLGDIRVARLTGAGETEFRWTFEQPILTSLYGRSVDDVERWALAATNQALDEYRALMAEASAGAQTIETCDVEALLKLTGNGFGPVVEVAKSKLMRSVGGFWVPHHRARAWLDTIAMLGMQLDIQEKVGAENTRDVLASVGLATLPVAIFGGALGSSAAVVATFVIDVVDVAHATYIELSAKWAQDAEVRFAMGVADVLGIARLRQAEAAQQRWSTVLVRLFYTIAPAAAAAGFDMPELHKAFREGFQFRKAARGRAVVMALNDIEPVAAGSAQADEMRRLVDEALDESHEDARQQLGEVIEDLGDRARTVERGAAAESVDGDVPLRLNFDELADLPAESVDDLATYLDGADFSELISELDAASLAAAEALARRNTLRERMQELFGAETAAELAGHIHRQDVQRLIESAGERLAVLLDTADALRARRAREVLRSEPGLDIDAFERRVTELMRRQDAPRGEGYYAQSRDPQVGRALRDAGWHARARHRADDRSSLDLFIRDPDGRFGYISRGYDPNSHTYVMNVAFREVGPEILAIQRPPLRKLPPEGPPPGLMRGMIEEGLPVPLDSQRGTPAMQFYTMRIMNWLDIPYGSADGIQRAEMSSVVNTTTVAQVNWFRRTYYPGKDWHEIPREELSEFLQMTFSGRYGAENLALAGYRIKSAKLVPSTIRPRTRMGGYESNLPVPRIAGESKEHFEARRAQEFTALLARYDLQPDDEVSGWFDIVFEVEPWQ